ncbi:secondary thiamine-phosphate synthase enzyme YjbQ [Synechococcus sp. AH-736-G21]|nr:secondary thiamine-phosphate synthase enzyme YjbQ [Synechococcus sp. AH-736-G21]
MGMQQILHQISVQTPGKGFTRLDSRLNTWIRSTGLEQGVLHLTCLHTSASLTINENADPRVLQDLDAWMADAVPEQRRYLHDDEGADDMPAHIRTALTSQTLSLSISRGQLLLGTWQAVYLWEHRTAGNTRTIACHLFGEPTSRPAPGSTQTTFAKPQTLMSLRNGERINQAIQARHDPNAWETDDGIDTDTDLMIDRLHDLSD